MIFFFVWHKDALTELMVTSHIQVQQPEIEKKHNRWRLDSTSWCHLATDEQRRFMFIWGSQRRAGTIARVPLKDYFRLGNVCQGRGASRLSRTVNWAPFFPPHLPPFPPLNHRTACVIAGGEFSLLWMCYGWYRCCCSHSWCGPAARLFFISKSAFTSAGWCAWPSSRSPCAYWKAAAETLKTWGEFSVCIINVARLTASQR